MDWKALWLKVKSNVYFVTATSAAFGAALDFAYDALQAGSLDFSAAGWHKLAAFVGGAVITALYHRYFTQPSSQGDQ